jgi:dihydrofolate reductase
MVIGGEAVYRRMLPLAQRLYLTELDVDVEGDAWFPELDATHWRELQREHIAATSARFGYSFVILQRQD